MLDSGLSRFEGAGIQLSPRARRLPVRRTAASSAIRATSASIKGDIDATGDNTSARSIYVAIVVGAVLLGFDSNLAASALSGRF